MKRWLPIAVAFSGLGSASHAQAPNAATLLEICSRKPSELATCTTYLKGFAGGTQIAMILRKEGRAICLPEQATTDQLRQVVTAFIKSHPDAAKRDGNAMAGVALWATFPCPGPTGAGPQK